MKRKYIILASAAAVVAAVGAIALALTSNPTPAYADDASHSTSFSIVVGTQAAGYADAVAAFSVAGTDDARVEVRIGWTDALNPVERFALSTEGHVIDGVGFAVGTVAVEEFPACNLTAYFTAYNEAGEITWQFSRVLQTP